MVFVEESRDKLPTISQVLGMIGEMTGKMSVRHRMPYDDPVDDSDVFLLNRTASGLFTLKPNITKQPCLYFGDSDYHRMLQPAWNRFKSRDEFMVQNVLREEFELVMESHPLYNLLKSGVPTRRLPMRIINPYGNAMAYGFPSPMIPLTSSLETAVFFATHKRNEQTDQWEAISETDEHGQVNVGVLYVLELAMPFPMMMGLSCIGMQAFKRPGEQRLFGLNIAAGENFNSHRLVYGFQFRQKPEEVRVISEKFKGGELLCPNELIAQKAADILKNHRVSEAAFNLNCKNNPRDDHERNRRELKTAGVEIVKEPLHLFTTEELESTYYPTAEQEWEEMFSKVVAVHPGFDRLLDDIRNFPNTDAGHKYFRR